VYGEESHVREHEKDVVISTATVSFLWFLLVKADEQNDLPTSHPVNLVVSKMFSYEGERFEVAWLHNGGGDAEECIPPVFKVPRQCPLVLLVGVIHMIRINVYMRLALSYSVYRRIITG
jgi:hypothetical protein